MGRYKIKGSPKTKPRVPGPEGEARLTRLNIQGIRTLANVTLDIDGLTALVGENGTGKSSILEACAILRRAATAQVFLDEFNMVHGGLSELRRFGNAIVSVGIEASIGPKAASYALVLGERGIEAEHLGVGGTSYIRRVGGKAEVLEEASGKVAEVPRVNPAATLLAGEVARAGRVVPSEGVFGQMGALLSGIEVHIPCDVTPRWVAREGQRPSPLRESRVAQPAERLSRVGENLANVFHELKDHPPDHWVETMDWVRLGLGWEVGDVVTAQQPGGGAIALSLRYKGKEQLMPAYALSDGELAFLAFVAVLRLGGNGLLAFDEPETHLHPAMVTRVLDFIESAAHRRPVIVATQSDRLLDSLLDPARSVVVCELDAERRTILQRLDRGGLERWRDRYSGVGEIRHAGHLRSIIKEGK